MKPTRKRLKEYFVPSEENDFQPHFLRARVAVFVLFAVLSVEGYFLAHTSLLPKTDYFAAIFASVLVDETNETRAKENISTLAPNPLLERAAELKAKDMAEKGYFSHNSPDGKTPWYWFKEVGYDYAAAGENLAVNFTDSRDVTEAWLASPTHRANIMSGNYTEIGIATAVGTYKGKEAIFVVQEFGRPSLVARVEAKIASSTDLIVSPKTETAAAPIARPRTEPTPRPETEETATALEPAPIAIETTDVAGASAAKLAVAPELAPIDGPVLRKAETGLFEQLVASPRQTSSALYLILAALVAIALGLAVFVKIRVQFPHIIANGVLLLALIIALILLNEALGFTQAIV